METDSNWNLVSDSAVINSTHHLDNVTTFNSNGSNTSVLIYERSTSELIWTSILLALIILITFFGNMAVIFAIYNSSRLREQASNLFIVNLSITDLSSGTIVMSTAFFALVLDVKHVDVVWCNIVCAANYIFIIVSMLILAFISVERYIAIVHTFKHNILVTRNRIKVVICYAWFQGLSFALPPVSLHWIHYDYWEVICAIDWQYQKRQAVYYVITACVVCFLVPAFIMLFCYMNIIRHARKVAQSVPTMGTTAPQQTQQGQDTNNPANLQIQKASKSASKTIRSLLVVVTLFFICMTPFCVTKFLKVIFTDAKTVPGYANLIAAYFGYISSMVNPFIYAIFRPDFRKAYHLVWYRLMSKFCLMERPNLYNSTAIPQTLQPIQVMYNNNENIPQHSNVNVVSTTRGKSPQVSAQTLAIRKEASTVFPGKVDSSSYNM